VLIIAGKRIRKLNFGRRNDPVLTLLRRVLRESRQQSRDCPCAAAIVPLTARWNRTTFNASRSTPADDTITVSENITSGVK